MRKKLFLNLFVNMGSRRTGVGLGLESCSGSYVESRNGICCWQTISAASGSRVSAPWPAVAGSFGLHASEGQFYAVRCPSRSLSQIRQSLKRTEKDRILSNFI